MSAYGTVTRSAPAGRRPPRPSRQIHLFMKNCPTHPRITISNILLIDVTSTGGRLLPGVLLGNATNPVRNLTFVRVHNQGEFIVRKDYVCEGVLGNAIDSSPAPSCFH